MGGSRRNVFTIHPSAKHLNPNTMKTLLTIADYALTGVAVVGTLAFFVAIIAIKSGLF